MRISIMYGTKDPVARQIGYTVCRISCCCFEKISHVQRVCSARASQVTALQRRPSSTHGLFHSHPCSLNHSNLLKPGTPKSIPPLHRLPIFGIFNLETGHFQAKRSEGRVINASKEENGVVICIASRLYIICSGLCCMYVVLGLARLLPSAASRRECNNVWLFLGTYLS